MITSHETIARGAGWRTRLSPDQRDAWIERLSGSAEQAQRALAALERDIEAALDAGCHINWIMEATDIHFRVIQRIRDEGAAGAWLHPPRRPRAPRPS